MWTKILFSTAVGIISFVACSNSDDIPESPSMISPKRVMLYQDVEVGIKGVKSGVDYTVDFGDGTTISATTPSTVVHTFSKSDDYTLTLTFTDIKITKRVRVYPLEALSHSQKKFSNPDYKKIWVMTHRANTADYSVPENSVSAVSAAIRSGAEALECDTHRTKDGHIVVCHNKTIDATTTGSGDITKMTLEEIRSYKLLDRNGNPTNEVMPTLEEFLKACRGKIYVDLDYSPRTASTAEVMAIVEKLEMMEQVWFYCNTEEKCREVLNLNPKAHVYTWATSYAPLKHLDRQSFIQYSYLSADPTPVTSAVKDGMLVSIIMLGTLSEDIPADTVDDKQLDELLKKYPTVKMIMTDCPEAMISALSKRGLR